MAVGPVRRAPFPFLCGVKFSLSYNLFRPDFLRFRVQTFDRRRSMGSLLCEDLAVFGPFPLFSSPRGVAAKSSMILLVSHPAVELYSLFDCRELLLLRKIRARRDAPFNRNSPPLFIVICSP